jgi:hypothetical protein
MSQYKQFPNAWARLINDEPWLQWQEGTQSYVYRVGGAAEGVLTTYAPGERIRLYRGTNPQETQFIAGLSAMLRNNKCGEGELQNLAEITRPSSLVHQALVDLMSHQPVTCAESVHDLVKAYAQNVYQLTGGNGGSFFSTYDGYASKFAKGSVLIIELTREQLSALVPSNSIYFGVELQSEFAFIGEAGLLTVVLGYRGSHDGFSNVYYEGDGISNHPIWIKPAK